MSKPNNNPDRAAALAVATAIKQREAKVRSLPKPIDKPAADQKADSLVATTNAPQPTQSKT